MKPSKENIERVELPMLLSTMLPKFDHPTALAKTPWVALVLALELAETQPDLSGRRPGPEWLTLLFEQLDGPPGSSTDNLGCSEGDPPSRASR